LPLKPFIGGLRIFPPPTHQWLDAEKLMLRDYEPHIKATRGLTGDEGAYLNPNIILEKVLAQPTTVDALAIQPLTKTIFVLFPSTVSCAED
jgi:hypothetical protein